MTITTQSPCSTFPSGNYSPGLQIFHTISSGCYCTSAIICSRVNGNKFATLFTDLLCGQWNVQWLETEYWQCSSVGYYGTWLWIRTLILSCGAIPQVANFLPTLRWGDYVTIGFESQYSFHWGMQVTKCDPSGLLGQEHPDWFKSHRHMLTSLVVYSIINCSKTNNFDLIGSVLISV